MKTAVEWYSDKLLEILGDKVNEFTKEQTLANHYALKEAKELEKQQIIDCCTRTTQDCFISVMEYLEKDFSFTDEDLKTQKKEAEQYYNQTFNK